MSQPPVDRRLTPSPLPTTPTTRPGKVNNEEQVSAALGQWIARQAASSEPLTAAKPIVRQAAPPDQLERRLQDSQKAATGSSGPASRSTWALAGQPLAGIKSGGNGAYKDETRTYQEEGVTYTQSTHSGPKGASSSTLTYEKDGVSYVETTTTANGNTTIRVEATSGDRVEVTTSETRTVPGDLEDYLPEGTVDRVDFEQDGQRGVTQQTTSQTVVTDNSQDPPVKVVVSESTGYSQKVGEIEPLESGQSVQLWNGMGPQVYGSLPEANYSDQDSGQFISYSVETRNGESTTTLSSDARVVGTAPDGHKVSLSNSVTSIVGPDGKETRILTYEEKGTIARADAENEFYNRFRSNDVDLAERFGETESPWLDSRTTTVYIDGDPDSSGITTTEFGELDRPGQNSISATSVSDGATYESVTFKKVSEDGNRVQTQTQLTDTNYNAVTDTHYGQNGEFTTESTTYAGDTLIGSSQTSRDLLYPEGKPLPAQAPAGYSQEAWDKFRKLHPDGPVYHDQVESYALSQQGVVTESRTDTHSGAEGQVGTTHTTEDGKATDLDFYQLDGANPSSGIEIDGVLLELNVDGDFVLDGKVVARSADLGLKGTQSLADIRKALSDAPALFANFNRFGGGAVDALGGVLGVIDFFGGDSLSDRIGGLGNASQGVAGVAEIFQTSASAARVARAAGVVGAGIQAGIGISELFDKNYAEGAVDIAAGAALFIPLLITGPAGVAVAATVGVIAAGVRWWLDRGDGPDYAYQFEGSEPDWAF